MGRAARDALLDLLAPPRCLSCRAPAPPPLCPECRARVDADGRPVPEPVGAPVAGVTVAARYRGPLRDAVVAAKARGCWRGWEEHGARIAAQVLHDAPPADVVTWVTTPAAVARRRGRDHARDLAAPVAEALGRPLRRLLDARARPDQVGRSAQGRRTLTGAFGAVGPLDGVRVLLVDDVLTTGGTARAAGRALDGAGAASIHLAVLARAGRRQDAGVEEGGSDISPDRAVEARGETLRVHTDTL